MSDTSEAPEKLQVEQVSVTPEGELSTPQVHDVPDISYIDVQDFLGISSPTNEETDKVKFIWESFSKGRDKAETFEAIKEAQGRLAAPAIGENYLHKLYSYTRLLEESRSVERIKKTYEHDGRSKLD